MNSKLGAMHKRFLCTGLEPAAILGRFVFR